MTRKPNYSNVKRAKSGAAGTGGGGSPSAELCSPRRPDPPRIFDWSPFREGGPPPAGLTFSPVSRSRRRFKWRAKGPPTAELWRTLRKVSPKNDDGVPTIGRKMRLGLRSRNVYNVGGMIGMESLRRPPTPPPVEGRGRATMGFRKWNPEETAFFH